VQGFAVIKVIFIFTEVLSMIGSHEDEGIVTKTTEISGFEELPDSIVGIGDLTLLLCQWIMDVSDPGRDFDNILLKCHPTMYVQGSADPPVVIRVVRRRWAYQKRL
jgi:hypothetical protein